MEFDVDAPANSVMCHVSHFVDVAKTATDCALRMLFKPQVLRALIFDHHVAQCGKLCALLFGDG